MRVGLNVATASGSFAGIGNYAFQLARHLPLVAPNEEWLFLGPDSNLSPLLTRQNARVVARSPGIARVFWEQTVLPTAARKARLDLLHGVDFSRPMTYRQTTVNTIHDLSPYADNRFFSLAKRTYKRALIPIAARKSKAIITLSEFSRREIICRFPFLEGRVFTIPLGVNPVCPSARPKTNPPFMLFVGTLENRKNVTALIEGFRILRERGSIPHRLILAGKPGHGWESIRFAIEKSGASDAIDVRGYVSQTDLLELYQSASLFVYPSVYEGFGLPVLEAMAHGIPVICSRAASLPEVGGDSVLYFDPHNAGEISVMIERVLSSPELQEELREKGLRRAAAFTWEECARKHVEAYRKILAQ